MSGVVSVERLTITLAAGTASASANLTKSQVLANCVPFMTKRVTTVASPSDNWAQQCVDILMESGPNRVTATTNDGSNRALVVEVTVVEFNSSKVKVQSGTFAMTAAETAPGTAPTVTAVDLAKTAMVCYWETGSTSALNNAASVRGRFSSTTALGFDRSTANGTIDGHWFVFEALNTEFAVDQVDITATGGSDTGTVTAVTEALTFLLCTFTNSDTTDDNADGTIECRLTNTTTVSIARAGIGGTIVATVFVIEFESGGDETVQRGRIVGQNGETPSQSIDITAVDLDVAMVLSPAYGSHHPGGSFPGSATSDSPDSQCAWDFVDTDTIRVQHSISGEEADNDISWEVVEWGLAGPTVEQEGYRWRNDDGSEAAATWLAVQEVDIVRGKQVNTRLRTLMNWTGDPATQQATLEYRRVGDADSEWRKVPL